MFLDFLEPGTTYYFEIVASPPGATCDYTYTTGTHSGSWSDPSDSMTTIQGVVTDASGATADGQYAVYAWCYDQYTGYLWTAQTTTNANGVYDLNAGDTCWDEDVGYNVGVLMPGSTGTTYFGYAPFYQWWGHWNETIVTWAPQYVNFVLPMTYTSAYLPAYVDYSNAPLGSTTYTSLQIGTGESFENEYTYSWSAGASVGGIGGGTSGSETAGQSYGVSYQEGVNEGNLCWAVQYLVTGMVEYSALTRDWSYSQSLADPGGGNFCSNEGVQVPSDWLTSSNSYYVTMPGTAYSNGLENVDLWDGETLQLTYTVSSSASISTGYDADFGVSGSLAGVLPLSFQASESWSQSATSTSSSSFSFTLNGPGTGAVSCYDVLGQGGSSHTADLISIDYWAGIEVNNLPQCGRRALTHN